MNPTPQTKKLKTDRAKDFIYEYWMCFSQNSLNDK